MGLYEGLEPALAQVDELERERAARRAGKPPHVPKAVRRAQRIQAAKDRSPLDRASRAIKAILDPKFGPRMRRFDLGKDCPEDVRLEALSRGAEVLLREDGMFIDGLQVRAVYAKDVTPHKLLLTVIPAEPMELIP